MTFDLTSQVENWRSQLLDTTKRSRLVNFKTGRGGGIALLHPAPADLWHRLTAGTAPLTFPWRRNLIDRPEGEDRTGPDADGSLTLFDPTEPTGRGAMPDLLESCLRSPRLRPDHLLTDLPDKQLAARLGRLAQASRESLTEQGVVTLFVAFGFLRWFEAADSQVELRSPLLLVPVRVERESVESPWKLQAEEEEVLPNYSLAQRLNQFSLHFPKLQEETPELDDPAWRTRYFEEVRRAVHHQPRWEVLDEAALGIFAFQKLAMWEDLGRNLDRIKAHDLCRAIARDPTVELRFPSDLPTSEQLDQTTRPDETHQVLDADSSQHAAILTAIRGASLVLDGPPGTGKSQTVANLIAEFLVRGKTVLFVSEKAAALEVVQRRLTERRLDDFCLELHSHKANKREVVSELGRCLTLAPEAFQDPAEDLRHLFEVRQRLNHYVRELHVRREPLGLSAFQVHGKLVQLSRLRSTSRCPVPQVLDRDELYLRRVTELLAQLPDCRGVIEGQGRHPWRGCRAKVYSQTLTKDVRHHFPRLVECLSKTIHASGLMEKAGWRAEGSTRAHWFAALEQARSVLACPLVPAFWFKSDPKAVAGAVIQLDQVTVRHRQVRAALPEFLPMHCGISTPLF
jgi:hypothetical protein